MFFQIQRLLSLKSNFSPVSQLPTEILSEIFSLCRPESPLKRRFDGPVGPSTIPDAGEFPALYVNKAWRTTAITVLRLEPLPIFLELDLPSNGSIVVRNEVKSKIIRRLERYLVESSPGPISFRVFEWVLDADPITVQLYPSLDLISAETVTILKLLCEHCERWEDVTLTLDPLVFHAIRNDIGSLPRLKSLSLRDEGVRRSQAGGLQALPSFEEANQLFLLTLHASLLQQIDFKLPWSQITTLTLSYSRPRYFHFILLHCTSLVECRLRDYDRTSDFWTAPQLLVSHLALRRLWFYACNLSHFLPLIYAPNVQELYVQGVAMNRVEDVRAISIALPHVEKLRVNFIHFHPSSGLPMLEELSSSTMILEMWSPLPGRAFEIMEQKSGIQHLRLKFRETADEASLLGLVKGRMLKGNRSESKFSNSGLLSFHVEASLSLETVDELRSLRESGLAISGLDVCDKQRIERNIQGNIWYRGASAVVSAVLEASLQVLYSAVGKFHGS